MLPPHALLPENFSRLRIEAVCKPAIVRNEHPIALRNRRGHVGHSASRTPRDFVRPGDISRGIRLDRQDVMIRKSTGDQKEPGFLVIHWRRHELIGRPIEHPNQLSRIGLVAGHAF